MMIDIEYTPIYREVERILLGDNTRDPKFYIAQIHLKDETIDVLKVISIDIERDYVNNYIDNIIINVALGTGTYHNRVYPERDTLEITLTQFPMYPTRKVKSKTIRYKAILANTDRPKMRSGEAKTLGTKMLDLTDIVEIEFQLLPLSNFALRTAQLTTIIHKTTVEDAVKGILTDQSKRLPSSGYDAIVGIEMYPPDNKAMIEQLPILPGTMLYQIPKYIQERAGGIYKGDIGSYVQDDIWFIFPIYDFQRPSAAGHELTLIVLPTNKLPGIDKTYRHDNDHTIALITSDAISYNSARHNRLNKGNGLHFTNSESLFSELVGKPSQNKIVTNGDVIVGQVNNNQVNDGLDFTLRSSERITSNQFHQESKLARLSAGNFACTWENSNPDLIFPGQMCRILTLTTDARVIEGRGTVIGAHHFTRLLYPGIVENRYITTTALTIKFDDSAFD